MILDNRLKAILDNRFKTQMSSIECENLSKIK